MQQLLWVTDIHLNFLDTKEREDFYNNVRCASADEIVIRGILERPRH